MSLVLEWQLVPASDPDAFKVVRAEVVGNSERVELQIEPGRIWADGFSGREREQTPSRDRLPIYCPQFKIRQEQLTQSGRELGMRLFWNYGKRH